MRGERRLRVVPGARVQRTTPETYALPRESALRTLIVTTLLSISFGLLVGYGLALATGLLDRGGLE